MDHIPYPLGSQKPPLTVPFLIPSSEIIDCSRASSQGYGLDSNKFLQQWKLDGLDPETAIAGAQRWLYFGLFSRFVDHSIDIRLCFEVAGHVNTIRLPGLLRKYRSEIQVTEGLDLLLRAAEREIRKFMAIEFQEDEIREKAELIALSIRILSDTLWCALRNNPKYAGDEYMRSHERYKNVYSSPGLNCDILRQRMRIEDGWCRATVSYILQNFTASTAYYLSSIGRHGDLIPHHLACSDSGCELIVDEDNYEQRHSSTCRLGSGCEMLAAPQEKLLDIIDGGGIPIMKLVNGKLKVRKAEFGLEYTAITHVWSGGLGNPKTNSMWLCQLEDSTTLPRLSQKELKSYVPPPGPERVLPRLWDAAMDLSRLRPTPTIDLFWIDTLCVPKIADLKRGETESVAGGELRDRIWRMRQHAINRMTQTYAAASSVVVLDPELRAHSHHVFDHRLSGTDENKTSTLELLAKVFCSGWMSRCWTYQEGAMASELLIQCEAIPFAFSISRSKIMARNRQLLQKSAYEQIDDILDEVSAWFSRLPATRANKRFPTRQTMSQSNPEVFTRIWNDLALRSSSRSIDRLQIFSLLVDSAPADLLQRHRLDRLKAILKSQPNLPLALLFQLPLSSEDRVKFEKELRREEKSDRDRGQNIPTPPEDDTYPLPARIWSQSLPSQMGWMKRDEDNDQYVYFTQAMLERGIVRPALLNINIVPIPDTPHLTFVFHEITSNHHFSIYFGSAEDLARINGEEELFLLVGGDILTGDSLTNNPHSGIPAVLLQRQPETRNQALRFRRVCSVGCESLGDDSAFQERGSYSQAKRLHWEHDKQYQIDCDFSNVQALRHHQISGFRHTWDTSFRLSSLLTPFLLFYYLLVLALTAPAAFTHGPISFPDGWFALIAFFFAMRVLIYVWNSHLDWSTSAQAIIFNDWVNGLNDPGNSSPTINRSPQRTGFYIHMTPIWTFIFGAMSLLFIILGASLYQRTGARWLIPVGVGGILELALRFLLELLYSSSSSLRRFFSAGTLAPRPEYPGLYQNFFAESLATGWIRRIFRSRGRRGGETGQSILDERAEEA